MGQQGEIETQLLALSKRSGNRFAAYIARPGIVFRAETRCPKLFLTMFSGIKVDALAICMVDCVIHGNPKNIIDHQELVDAGRMLLANMVDDSAERQKNLTTDCNLDGNIHASSAQDAIS